MAHVLKRIGDTLRCECGEGLCALNVPRTLDGWDCAVIEHRQHVLARLGLWEETLEKFGVFACQHSSARFGPSSSPIIARVEKE